MAKRPRAEDTTEEISGPLVDYLRGKDARLLRVYLVNYAEGYRDKPHVHNPWVLSWYDHHGVQLPAKMPLWTLRYFHRLPDETLVWEPVPREPPAQGSLF